MSLTSVTETVGAVEIFEGVYRVPMSTLAELIESPFEWCPWDCNAFTIEDVEAVSENEYCDQPFIESIRDKTPTTLLASLSLFITTPRPVTLSMTRLRCSMSLR
jgi:hypothetical protein